MRDTDSSGPDLSVVVVAYNMPREAPRTLLSLSPRHQREIDPRDYEVIVVDNGSEPPLDPGMVADLGESFRLIRIERASRSPARAVNLGIAEARGDVICVMVDGARLATPGLLHFGRAGVRIHETAVVATLGWYLGHDFQRYAMRDGYDQAAEDALLAKIGWPQDGYRLFEIGTMDESSAEGWLQPIAESNALFMRRELWDAIGGVDEAFGSPGGGLLNLDTLSRALSLPDGRLVLLLGEGTFHQLHGGVATNAPPGQMADNWRSWSEEYERIRGRPYSLPRPAHPPVYLGRLPRAALRHFVRAALAPVRRGAEPPLGRGFDPELWIEGAPRMPADPALAHVVALAQTSFRAGRYADAAALARLVRHRAPEEPEPQRLLSLVASALEAGEPLDAGHFLLLGEARRLLGDEAPAAADRRQALTSGLD